MKQRNEVSNPETNTPEVTQTQTNIPQQPVEGTTEQPLTEPMLPQKTSKKWILPGLVGLVVVALGLAGYFAYQNLQLRNEQSSPEQIIPTPTSTQSPSTTDQTTPTSIVEPDKIPQVNSLYLGTYNNSNAIFVTDEEKQKYFDPGAVPKTSQYMGELTSEGGGSYDPFDYQELLSPRKIYTSSQAIHSVNSFKINDEKSIAYVSLNYLGSNPNSLLNKIVKIEIETQMGSEIWTNEIGSATYEGAGGIALVDSIEDDRYLTFTLLDCYACSPGVAGMGILNISNKQDKYHKDIGNVQISMSTNSYSYQKLAPFEEACDPSPGCNDGKRTVYKPSGQTYSETLP